MESDSGTLLEPAANVVSGQADYVQDVYEGSLPAEVDDADDERRDAEDALMVGSGSNPICAHLPGLVQDAQDKGANMQGRAVVDLSPAGRLGPGSLHRWPYSSATTCGPKRRLRKDPVQVRLVLVVGNLSAPDPHTSEHPPNQHTSQRRVVALPFFVSRRSGASKKSRNIWLPCNRFAARRKHNTRRESV